MYDPVPQLKLSCWAPDPRAQLECACAKPLATWLPGNRGLAAPGVGEYSFTMTKFVLAGRADCPFYAKAELLADYLQKNLPDFRVHKITQHPHVWEEWLEDLCKKNKWNHKNSPIIWRELLDRGGKGLLLGGYNEFLEHAQLYYGVTSSMTTEMMKVIAQENLMTHIEDEQEKEALKQLIEPLNVWITSASSRPCYNLIPILTSGEVFGMHTEISITLFDDEKTEENLQILVTEMWDLVSPLLQSVSICTRVEEAFLQAHVIIILDDHTDKEVYTLEDCIRSRVPLCRLYGYLIEKNAHDSVRVIVGGKTFVNLKTVLLMRYAPNITHNIIAVALGVEGEAKAALARKLKTTSSCQFGIPEGIVFSMPVKFENGTWVVLTDLKDIEISEQIMTRMTSDLIQEKLVALGDLIYFQPYQSETLSTKRNKKTTLSTTNDNQEVQSISDVLVSEHKDSIHSSVLQEEEKDLVMSDVDFADLISETNPEQLLSQEPINEPEGKTMEQ
ncbi:putative malate dehydrogenase 1B isoform X4 [Pteropus medius]|uniref:putative malate dehydrogenase 1B isoform X4 n=1 Tax=Pteropus vampyrus TaxID=132908 RepID=UPI00196AF90D|nr:putative malate dehydrogenase 1B isoform X4 [Pteropus giganteus]